MVEAQRKDTAAGELGWNSGPSLRPGALIATEHLQVQGAELGERNK